MTTITSPNPGHNGKTFFGPLEVEFKDGKATVDDLPTGVREYMLRAGYTVGRTHVDQPAAPEPADSREAHVLVGTPLRDAAVDPREGDYLVPINAGKADPHGPLVIAPQTHGSQDVRPIRPGPVHVDDPDRQDAAETAHAAASVDGEPVPGAEPVAELKGQALDDALEQAGLAKSGTADEKRARLAQHRGESAPQ